MGGKLLYSFFIFILLNGKIKGFQLTWAFLQKNRPSHFMIELCFRTLHLDVIVNGDHLFSLSCSGPQDMPVSHAVGAWAGPGKRAWPRMTRRCGTSCSRRRTGSAGGWSSSPQRLELSVKSKKAECYSVIPLLRVEWVLKEPEPNCQSPLLHLHFFHYLKVNGILEFPTFESMLFLNSVTFLPPAALSVAVTVKYCDNCVHLCCGGVTPSFLPTAKIVLFVF